MVKFFDMPTNKVAITDLFVDTTKKTFTAKLGVKEGRKAMKFEDISGTITNDLAEFFSLKRKQKIQVTENGETKWVPTGVTETSFERWLGKKGQTYVPGTLRDMLFEDDAHSESALGNPFKVIRLLNGKNILSLVWVASKKKTESVDVNTGEVSAHYTKKYYRDENNVLRPSFTAPQYYRRLIIESLRQVVPATAQEAAGAQ